MAQPARRIDFHTHILPAMDDGAKSVEVSLQMLSCLQEQGVNTVVLTPHYYSHHEPLETFLTRRRKAYDRLLEAGVPQGMELRLGAEVYLTEYLFNTPDLMPLCIDGTHTMLVEMPFSTTSLSENLTDQLERLTGDHLIKPVMAHIERYPKLCRSPDILDMLREIGCVLQSNLKSFTVYGKRRLFKLAEQGYICVVGTDAHNMTTRAPMYNLPLEKLSGHTASRTLQNISDTMEQLLQHE